MDGIAALAIYAIVFILVFLGLREFFCWYWKINKRLETQEEILRHQKKQLELMEKIYSEQYTCKAFLEVLANQDAKSA